MDITDCISYDNFLLILDDLYSKEDDKRYLAAKALELFGLINIPFLKRAMQEETDSRKRLAAYFLALLSEHEEALPFLIQELDNENTAIKETAVLLIGELGESVKSAIPKLNSLFETSEIGLQMEIIRAIYYIDNTNSEIINFIFRLLQNQEDEIVEGELLGFLRRYNIANSEKIIPFLYQKVLEIDDKKNSKFIELTNTINEIIEYNSKAKLVLIEELEKKSNPNLIAKFSYCYNEDVLPEITQKPTKIELNEKDVKHSEIGSKKQLSDNADFDIPKLIKLLDVEDYNTRLHSLIRLQKIGKGNNEAIVKIMDLINHQSLNHNILLESYITLAQIAENNSEVILELKKRFEATKKEYDRRALALALIIAGEKSSNYFSILLNHFFNYIYEMDDDPFFNLQLKAIKSGSGYIIEPIIDFLMKRHKISDEYKKSNQNNNLDYKKEKNLTVRNIYGILETTILGLSNLQLRLAEIMSPDVGMNIRKAIETRYQIDTSDLVLLLTTPERWKFEDDFDDSSEDDDDDQEEEFSHLDEDWIRLLREYCLQFLIESDLSDDGKKNYLRKLIKDEDGKIRKKALEALVEIEEKDELLRLLQRVISIDSYLKEDALNFLEKIKNT